MEHFLLISVKAKTARSKETCIQAKASLSHYLRPLSVPDAILSPKLGSLYITHSYLAMVSPNTLRTALGVLGLCIHRNCIIFKLVPVQKRVCF